MNKQKEIVPVNNGIIISDMDDLCRNSIELIQYARGIVARQAADDVLFSGTVDR